MVYLTRKEHFNAAHRLYNPKLSDEQNEIVFGKCANKNFHGHNYNLYVTVKGEADADTGIIVNLKELSKIINTNILEKLDHKNLNLEVDFLKGIIPSTENLVKAIWEELKPRISGCELHSIKLFETENNYAEYFGE
ncbi:MAG TPA: 6-carboxytetrahydropterin synthase [Chitinophagales bacterium]|nr:6-carboxytetrahydropterin synthase [Chitinophagales bacterium]